MSSKSPTEDTLSRPYYFRKLKSKIYTLCFFVNGIDKCGVRDQVHLHLMKTLFFGDGNFKNKFIHIVNTHGEISLFLDKHSLDRFNHDLSPSIKEVVVSDSSCFRAVEIYSLESDLHSPGVTSLISGKLAAKGIPIIYTNSFNSSFILVPENYYSLSCAILKSVADQSPSDEVEDESI